MANQKPMKRLNKAKRTYFIEPYETPVPAELDEWKVALPPRVVEQLITRYSKEGDVVYDPFAGYGTVVAIANRIGREAFGTEIEDEPVSFAKQHYGVDIIQENAFSIDLEKHPKIDLCIFSPPYWGPSLGVDTYEAYLEKLEELVERIKPRMKEKARLIILIQNYHTKKGLLTQAWDVGNAIRKHLFFEQDLIWCVDRSKQERDMEHEAADHHYCLVYQNT